MSNFNLTKSFIEDNFITNSINFLSISVFSECVLFTHHLRLSIIYNNVSK